jgi:hypothetical protein
MEPVMNRIIKAAMTSAITAVNMLIFASMLTGEKISL